MKPNFKYSLIQPHALEHAWIQAMPWIQRSVEILGGDNEDMIMIQDGLRSNMYQLWAIEDVNKPICFLITELRKVGREKVILIRWLGGTRMKEWLEDITIMESWAVANGFHRIEMMGRKGWQRVLCNLGFKEEYVIMSKTLTRGMH